MGFAYPPLDRESDRDSGFAASLEHDVVTVSKALMAKRQMAVMKRVNTSVQNRAHIGGLMYSPNISGIGKCSWAKLLFPDNAVRQQRLAQQAILAAGKRGGLQAAGLYSYSNEKITSPAPS
jgi:hypothetical protein